jgi:hypothetical protein
LSRKQINRAATLKILVRCIDQRSAAEPQPKPKHHHGGAETRHSEATPETNPPRRHGGTERTFGIEKQTQATANQVARRKAGGHGEDEKLRKREEIHG